PTAADTRPTSSASAVGERSPAAEVPNRDRGPADRAGSDGNRPDRNQPARNQADRSSSDRNQGDRNQGDRNQQPQARAAAQGSQAGPGNQAGSANHAGQANQNQGAQGHQGNQGNQNQANQVGQGDDGESGNRRRRRRGRDRDRAADVDEVFAGEPVDVEGLLDLRDEGYGFLRLKGYLPSRDDVYVSVKQTRQLNLRKGDRLKGKARPAGRNEKNPALLQIDEVNGTSPDTARQRARFEDLTPLFPDSTLRLERSDAPLNMTARIVDLISPIGKGQRGLIVSPPKAGKTTVMKEIARSIERNNPEVELIVLLVDERPEEVTDMKRWLDRGEVAASTFDRPAEEHTQVAELVIERAKRMVEEGKDVVIILDGITRLARAYNLAAPATGRIMSGGIDTGALYPPKKFFGAARNVEEGGSLTILATALVETGSKMDEVIFEEFKGTGNMELKLDRRLADRRIFPAIDVDASSTRHEELLFERRQLEQVWKLRRVLSGLKADEGASSAAGLELLIDRMKSFKSNAEFLAEIAKASTAG
ncbi:MAG: transcription termination factor Rho, partial [Acidimicrobiales bacterium]|nr:transcription termination factor Rho [Acidimicrobiales bacterium]